MSNPGPSAAGFNQADLLALQEALKDSYILQDQIGAGGMGTVFKAHDVKHHRTVAIKVLRGDLARAMGPERFQREIETAAKLMHPHIISVFNSGTAANMLYYVMPYVAGESLRDRLMREGALSVDHAVHIARQLASALGYAHAAGIIHRDIKPENILLADGHAWLADFGIARAALNAGDGHHTTTGAIIGSPDYVSPEHLRGREVDGRADIYSLGCVLYEMLAGRAPFAGKSLEATMLGHMTQSPPLTPIPKQLRRVVSVALAKLPEERFSSAEEFERALAGAPVRRRWTRTAKRRAAGAAGLVTVAVFSVLAITAVDARTLVFSFAPKPVALDTTRYLVLPFSENGSEHLDVENAVHTALTRWNGLDVIRSDEVSADLHAASSPRAIARVTRRSDIGRVVRNAATRVGDTTWVTMELLDGADPRTTLARSPRIAAAAVTPEVMRRSVENLLLRDVSPSCRAQTTGTASLDAIHACNDAFSAIAKGDLAAADSHFVAALRVDARYARAALWLAQVRSWVVPHPRNVAPQIHVALADTISLDNRERRLFRGIAALRGGNYDQACRSFSQALSTDTLDYAAWLGIGECHSRDRAVVRDAGSPSGWSFKRSYNVALSAYQRAFELHPALLAAYRDRSFYDLRMIFLTDANKWLVEQSSDDAAFAALPSMTADTLAFVPYPMALIEAARIELKGITTAIDRQRDVFHDLATRWSELDPGSSAAAEASAVAAELMGDARAISETVRARGLARDDVERRRLAAHEVWLHVKFGLAGDEKILRRARVLADSLIALPIDDAVSAREFAPLAVLVGRPARAANFARIAAAAMAADYSIPIGVAEPAAALEVFASVGAPIDSIARLEQDLSLAIRNGISRDKQQTAAADLLTRPVMVAFPSHRLSGLVTAARAGAFIDAERAFARGDRYETRATLQRISDGQRFHRPADLTPDGVFVVAWLHRAIGQSGLAADKLDAWLAAARWFPPRRLHDSANAGSLLRAMLLRAQIAAQAGDNATAEQWYRRLRILWSGAEPDLLKLIAASS